MLDHSLSPQLESSQAYQLLNLCKNGFIYLLNIFILPRNISLIIIICNKNGAICRRHCCRAISFLVLICIHISTFQGHR